MHSAHPGTQGYAEHASRLLERWALLDVEATYAPIMPYLQASPGRALDIGVGAGDTSAYLALRGWDVTATEPVGALRSGAMRRHSDLEIRWLDDALPVLPSLNPKTDRFDLVLGLAVLMHLNAVEQREAVFKAASLVEPGGHFLLSLRHGPTPKGRVMHPISALEIVKAGRSAGFDCAFIEAHGSVQASNQAAGVTWTWLAFKKNAEPLSEVDKGGPS